MPQSVGPRIFTIPNALTLSRIPLAVVVWLVPPTPAWILTLMAVAAITDMLDGKVARWLRAKQEARGEAATLGGPRSTGAWLDPICDKLFIVSALGAVWINLEVPSWQIALIVSRELIQAPAFLFYWIREQLRGHVRYDFRAAIVGKINTVAQFAAVGAILFRSPLQVSLAWVTGTLGAITALYYIRRRALAEQKSRAGETDV